MEVLGAIFIVLIALALIGGTVFFLKNSSGGKDGKNSGGKKKPRNQIKGLDDYDDHNQDSLL